MSLTAEGESVLRRLDEVFAPLSAEERMLPAELLARVLEHHTGIGRS